METLKKFLGTVVLVVLAVIAVCVGLPLIMGVGMMLWFVFPVILIIVLLVWILKPSKKD